MCCHNVVHHDESDHVSDLCVCPKGYWCMGPFYCYIIGGISLIVPLLLLVRAKKHAR